MLEIRGNEGALPKGKLTIKKYPQVEESDAEGAKYNIWLNFTTSGRGIANRLLCY